MAVIFFIILILNIIYSLFYLASFFFALLHVFEKLAFIKNDNDFYVSIMKCLGTLLNPLLTVARKITPSCPHQDYSPFTLLLILYFLPQILMAFMTLGGFQFNSTLLSQ